MAYTANSSSLIARMIIIKSARCRQNAAAAGYLKQQAIYASLNEFGCGILAPVLDSLFDFFEASSGHSFRAGALGDCCPTKDERHLLGMLKSCDSANSSFWSAPGHNAPSPAMKIAIKSTRVMMELVLSQREPAESKCLPIRVRPGEKEPGTTLSTTAIAC